MAMTTEQTQDVLMAYAQALLAHGDFGRYMGDDVSYMIMNSGREVRGRAAAVEAIIADHTPAREIRLRGVVAGAGRAMAEAEFVRQDGTALPYTIAYDFTEGRIAALRVYFAGEVPGKSPGASRSATVAGPGRIVPPRPGACDQARNHPPGAVVERCDYSATTLQL
jgi:hypothetical protein